MQKSSLSKSLYTRGLQCQKSLWLKKYKKEVLRAPDSSTMAIFETGNKVGDLACDLFPGGTEIPFAGTTFNEKVTLTKNLIDQGIKSIYEATFEYDGILVIVDILHVNHDGSYEIYEVKSSTSVHDIHYQDAAIQYYVVNGLGYKVETTNIIHLNNKYIRTDKLEIEKLFTIADISTEILELQNDIPGYIKDFRQVLASDDVEPKIDIGEQCTSPYECDAKAYCWKQIPEYSVFNISGLHKKKKFGLYHKGILRFDQITDYSVFNNSQQIQIQSELKNETLINKQAIREFVNSIIYPIYYLDFETFQQAIPEWPGISPYMQIPFQYSLHIEFSDCRLEHKEFLAETGCDPRYKLAKRLIEDIPSDVIILAYHMGFEKRVIRKLAETYTEFKHKLMIIHNNIRDLMTPFQSKDYYAPSMMGSYSIKNVLPALIPEMAHAYSELEEVQNGNDAMSAFSKLSEINSKAQISKLRNALLEYCKLDTLAMVKILHRLRLESAS